MGDRHGQNVPGPGERKTIVIGIDFGTTFSGVSWAFSGQPNNTEVITQWPSELSLNSDTEKTPSTLLYGNLQYEAFWGYGVPDRNADECLKWFKLLLIDSRDLTTELRQSCQIGLAKKLLKESNRDVVEVISSYLRHLWNHSIDCIARSTGKGLLRLCKLRVVVTIPAIWPEYSKARMKRAVEDAGILEARPAGETVLSFVSEPEAAALTTLYDLQFRPDISSGDHFVVCDAGGGTVDLITYEVVTTDPMVVKESIKGEGRLCGCLFLDQAFVQLVRSRVGSQTWDALPNDEVRRLLHNDWEHGIKRQFYGQQRDWLVHLPYECRSAQVKKAFARKPMLILNETELGPVFCQIAGQIEELVQKQVDEVQKKYQKTPKYVILVGGFGRCAYLHNRLVQKMGTDTTEVLQAQGSRPWSAICRGAVIRGLTQLNDTQGFSVKIASRIARVSYGLVFHEPYDPKIHLKTDRFWDEKEMKWMADNQVRWYLKQGADVSDTISIARNYYHLYEKPPEEISTTLYYSKAPNAPGRRDETVKRLCTVTWSKRLDFESLPKFTNPAGKVFSRVTFDIEVTCDGTSLDFTVVHGGNRVAATNVRILFETTDSDEAEGF